MIAIVDYGLGNIKAFADVLTDIGYPFLIASEKSHLRSAKKIILPGVGAFDSAMKKLIESDMRDCLDDLVLSKGIPILGVCVGMQIFGNSSEEGTKEGLGWIEGKVSKVRPKQGDLILPLPHMGWNLIVTKSDQIFKGIDAGSYFYFLHSYAFSCANNTESIATAIYGETLTCAIRRDNVIGVQFHPEKSHLVGAKLINNFCQFG